MVKHLVYISILYYLFSCNSSREKNKNQAIAHCDGLEISIRSYSENDTLFYIYPSSEAPTSPKSWKLPYPVYHWEIADVDRDGCDEILVGVIKTARFDSKEARRLFIFKLFDGHIRPKWMGSRLSLPLIDFKAIGNEKSFVLSLEQKNSDQFFIAYYEYGQFGLEFQAYLHQELSEEIARILFQFY